MSQISNPRIGQWIKTKLSVYKIVSIDSPEKVTAYNLRGDKMVLFRAEFEILQREKTCPQDLTRGDVILMEYRNRDNACKINWIRRFGDEWRFGVNPYGTTDEVVCDSMNIIRKLVPAP